MKQITKIQAQKKPGRYNIFLNQVYAFSVSAKIIADFILTKGKELTDADILQIKQADQNSRAEEKALTYLGYQPRTTKELKQYLHEQEIDDEIITTIIANLADLGYLDDAQYAQLFIRNNLQVGHDGPRVVKSKLIKKGVSADLIDPALENVEFVSWFDLAQQVVKPLYKKVGRMSAKEITQKMRVKLMTHGFSNEVIAAILAEVELDDEDEQLEALKQQGIKAYKKTKRYTGFEREQKMKQYLFQRGFNSSEIQQFLAGEIIPLEELADY